MINIKAIICAGGTGTRLWPVSRKNSPKQFKPFLDNETLLQKTHGRLSAFLKQENIYLCTPIDLKAEMSTQVPVDEERFILEPLRRDTAPALGLAILKIFLKDPQAIVTNIWADHYIDNQKLYQETFQTAEEFIDKHPEKIFMVGVKPEYPETGYGYIKMGDSFETVGEKEIFNVDAFKEKPTLEVAEDYLKNGKFLWNPAMFFFRADHFLNLFAKHSPEIYSALMKIKEVVGTPDEGRVTHEEFEKLPKISIDYAIFEKEKELFVMPADLGWTDVGNWRSIYDMLTARQARLTGRQGGHAVKGGNYVEIDSSNNLIFSETGQMISTIGVHDSLVIVTKDAILICEKSRAQDVKKIVDQLSSHDLHHLM